MRKIGYALWLSILASCNTKQERTVHIPLPVLRHSELPTIHTASPADINALSREANKWIPVNVDSAIILYQEALRMSRHIPYPQGVASACNNLGICFQQKEDFERANQYLKEGIAYLKGAITSLQSKSSELPELYNYLLSFYMATYQPEAIIKTCHMARSLFTNRSDSLQRALYISMYDALGWAYWQLNQYDSATAVYLLLVDKNQPVNNDNYSSLTTSYIALGSVSAKILDTTKALHYFNQAAQLAKTYRDSTLYTNALSNIATLFFEQKHYRKARYYARQVMDMARHLPTKSKIDYLFQGAYTMAVSLMDEDKPEEAMPYSKMALENAKENPAVPRKISAFYILGANYARCKDYPKAEQYLYSGLLLAKANNRTDDISSLCGQLGIVAARMGDYPKAYHYKSSYIVFRDSLRGKENAGRIAAINAKYHLAQKDKELAEKELLIERQKRKQYLWAGTALFSIMILAGLLWRKQHKTALKELKATLAGEEKERSRMARELHDGIVSRLSIIKTNFSALPQYHQEDSETAAFHETIQQLDMSIAELRTTAHNLLPQILVDEGLVATIDQYCKKIGKQGRINITCVALGRLPPLSHEFQLNVYRIVQELLQNVIKHSGATQVLVQLTIRKDELELTVDDNGSGMPAGYLSAYSPGIGLQNIQNRIRLLNGKMEIEQDKGTSVYLRFDLRKFRVR